MVQSSETFESLVPSIYADLSLFVTDEVRLAVLTTIATTSNRHQIKEVVARKTGIRQASVYQVSLRLRNQGYITYESNLHTKTGSYAIAQPHRLRILCAITSCLNLLDTNAIQWLEPEDEKMDEATIVQTLRYIFASDACLMVYLGRCGKHKLGLSTSLRSKYTRRLILHGYLNQDKTVNTDRYAQFSLALRSLAALLKP